MRLFWGWCKTVKRRAAVLYLGPPTCLPLSQACFCQHCFFPKQIKKCVWVWVEWSKKTESPPLLMCFSGEDGAKVCQHHDQQGRAVEYHGDQSSVWAGAERSWDGLGHSFISFSYSSSDLYAKKYAALKCSSLLLCCPLVLPVQLFAQLCSGLAQRPFAVKNNTSPAAFFFVSFF